MLCMIRWTLYIINVTKLNNAFAFIISWIPKYCQIEMFSFIQSKRTIKGDRRRGEQRGDGRRKVEAGGERRR